ncbi:MAG: OadG family protein [Lentisphaerae bacterium]|jgi:sodium pump decarboxylase gamma subunit|nr:OadG family protein [Lentisphaerota bacterium]
MSTSSQFADIGTALILMIAGMGMTFLFLMLQIWCTEKTSKISARFSHLVPDSEPKKSSKPAPAAPAADEGEVVAAIAAAIHATRS